MSRKNVALLAAAFLIPVSVSGCGEPDEEEAVPPRWSAIEERILKASCVFSSCHDTTAPKENLSLVAPSYGNVVNVASREVPGRMRVAPGDPDGSYLLEKIEKAKPAVKDQMPPGQPLSAARIKTIRDWIAAGAMND